MLDVEMSIYYDMLTEEMTNAPYQNDFSAIIEIESQKDFAWTA